MTEIAVRFENVYKEYPFYQGISAGFKSFLFNLPKNLKMLKRASFTALKDVSFEVKKGETFGIIGRNGSGKSTILSLIAGVIKQDKGNVFIKGRVSSLLELGSGFHPDLSGVENIILNGILMGNTKTEMFEKLEDIISFSELGDFIYQPIRTYSSGMYVRLGFSVAVYAEPDILLIDEALAVGDSRFQEKCLQRISEFRKAGVTTIIVSHDMSSIKGLCDRVMWLENGMIKMIGGPEEVVYAYLESLEGMPSFQPPAVSTIAEPIQDDTMVNPQKEEITWWDSGVVIDSTERLITGKQFKDFYEYLTEGMGLKGLSGLCVLNKLKHSRSEFIKAGVCKSLKAIDGEDLYKECPASYDLFISIDFLGSLPNMEDKIKKIGDILRGNGILVAIDLLDSTPYSEKDWVLANGISGYLGLDNKALINNNLLRAKDSLLEVIKGSFEVIHLKFLGGVFYDLVINRILNSEMAEKEALIKAIIAFEQILIEEKILKGRYGLIIGKKRTNVLSGASYN